MIGNADTTHYMMNQFGNEYTGLEWKNSEILTGPAPYPGYLVSADVPGRDEEMYIHGFFISATEMNDFFILWQSQGEWNQYYITFGSEGTMVRTTRVPMNNTSPIYEGDECMIVAWNAVGALQAYQAGLLLGKKKMT